MVTLKDMQLKLGLIWISNTRVNGKIIILPVINLKKDVLLKGRGKQSFPGGDFYIGDFKDSKFEGFGKFFSKEFGEYIGEWKNGRPFGKVC